MFWLITIFLSYVTIGSCFYQYGAIEHHLKHKKECINPASFGFCCRRRINWWGTPFKFGDPQSPICKYIFPILWPIFLPTILLLRINSIITLVSCSLINRHLSKHVEKMRKLEEENAEFQQLLKDAHEEIVKRDSL